MCAIIIGTAVKTKTGSIVLTEVSESVDVSVEQVDVFGEHELHALHVSVVCL